MRIPLMFVPLDAGVKITRGFRGLSGRIITFFPRIKSDLIKTDIKVEADEYAGACVASALATGLSAFVILLIPLTLLGVVGKQAIMLSGSAGAVIFVLFLVVLLFYPSILAGKKSELIEKDLVFALKHMLLEISAGASLYDALAGVSRVGYGLVSSEFSRVVRMVDAGLPVDEALEELALKTTSDHMKNSVWQIINALKAGSNIESTLREIIRDLIMAQRSKIRNYAQELNILSLIYMMFAVVVPTIAVTILIILGPFLGLRPGISLFYVVVPLSFFIQIAILELIKSRRPVVNI